MTVFKLCALILFYFISRAAWNMNSPGEKIHKDDIIVADVR